MTCFENAEQLLWVVSFAFLKMFLFDTSMVKLASCPTEASAKAD